LRLAFDNAARSAYLSQPAEGESVNAAAVSVAGTALVASEVRIEGAATKQDAQGRFRALVSLAPDQKTISVRVAHPASGVHYYLRRVR
jgi:hypothetical protein